MGEAKSIGLCSYFHAKIGTNGKPYLLYGYEGDENTLFVVLRDEYQEIRKARQLARTLNAAIYEISVDPRQ